MATKLTSKGQVTVSKKVRDYLGLKPGSAVTFERLPSGDIVLRPAKRPCQAAKQIREAARSGHRAHDHRRDPRTHTQRVTRWS